MPVYSAFFLLEYVTFSRILKTEARKIEIQIFSVLMSPVSLLEHSCPDISSTKDSL